jgi:phosphoribosyl-ATP pyrophosphohydrolase/phosphoribosyl-AMP cyclohydrolase
MDDLVPAIVQDSFDGRVLMQAYMNRAAMEKTLTSGQVTFWSRSRNTLWTKGESSGNHLELVSIRPDCDGDCLLVMARPTGPVCHLGTATCFDQDGIREPELAFLAQLERVISQRQLEMPEGSYTTSLFESGVKRIAQKVGEEGVEAALAAVAGDPDEIIDESADLVYHLMVLLRSKNIPLEDLVVRLRKRHS